MNTIAVGKQTRVCAAHGYHVYPLRG